MTAAPSWANLHRRLAGQPATPDHERYRQQAIELVAGRKGREAFDLAREPADVPAYPDRSFTPRAERFDRRGR